jgi:hypothetical protein
LVGFVCEDGQCRREDGERQRQEVDGETHCEEVRGVNLL